MWNVLVFPGGTECALEIRRALVDLRIVRLVSVSAPVSSHAPYVFRTHYEVPSIHESHWIQELNEVIRREGIDYVFPAHDDVVLALSENANRLDARVVTSPHETCFITRSKNRTYAHLSSSVPVPRVYSSASDVREFPVFVKPDRGAGSDGTGIAHSAAEMLSLMHTRDDLMVCEFLPGDEFTVDCFTDREQGLAFCRGRRRVRTRSGISVNSTLADGRDFTDLAKAIGERLEFHGAWFFQVKHDRNGILRLMEVAPRISGTSAVQRVRGVNLPLLSLYEQERIPVTIHENNYDVEIDRSLANRYRHDVCFSTVYVDLDDTLIVHGNTNKLLIRFIYQCVERNIPVNLLTRHTGDLEATLRQYRLTGLFDSILHVDAVSEKSDLIAGDDAILIDDSYSERVRVADRCRVVTFDSSMIELLIDDRQ